MMLTRQDSIARVSTVLGLSSLANDAIYESSVLIQPVRVCALGAQSKAAVKISFRSTGSSNVCRKGYGRIPKSQQGAQSGSVRACAASAIHQVVPATEKINLMIVSDLDFTMVDHEDPENLALVGFNALWAADYAHNSVLVFSSGRSPKKYQELRKQVPLLTPNVGIFSVGTEILYGPSLEPDVGWEEFLDEGWNRDVVVEEAQKFPALRFQEDSEQRPHKVSFFVEADVAEEIMAQLSSRLRDVGLKVKLIYSGSHALDLLPERAGKGEALVYLLGQMEDRELAPKTTLVCGDSGNDIELFSVEGVKGVIVGNGMEELVQWYDALDVKDNILRADHRCAAGIMQAIQYFGLGPST